MGTVETVQGMFEALGRGDVPAIRERLADDVEWEPESVDRGIEHLRHRHGTSGISRSPKSRAVSPPCSPGTSGPWAAILRQDWRDRWIKALRCQRHRVSAGACRGS